MSASEPRAITLSLTTLDQLFNAPAVNPFSEKVVEVRGESGMSYLLRQLGGHQWDERASLLTIRLPSDQVTAGLQPRLSEAVRRYCQARVESNRLDIHTIRARSSTGLGVLLAIVAVLIAAIYILFTQIAPDTPQPLQFAVAATLSLFAWVSLWDPLEALLFNPLEPMRENRLLRRIMEMRVAVEPEIAPASSEATRVSGAGSQTFPTEA